MLHETLIYLLYNCNPNETSKLYELQELLHPGEKKLLENIIEIASKYHEILSFCKTTQTESGALAKHGLYIKAFADGIIKVLGGYKDDVIKLEETMLRFPKLSLTSIFCVLEKHEVLFNMLKTMIESLQKEDLHGCLLMGRLHMYIYSGVDCVANAAETINQCLNSIFYRHLCNWIIYGGLVDIHNEFFICDGKCSDEIFLYPEQIEEMNQSNNTSTTSGNTKKTRVRRPPPVRKFFINWEMLPTFITEDTAERILFMGRIVWIVRNDPKVSQRDHYETKRKRDIWDGKDIEYYRKVQALETQTFNQVEFERTIEECRVRLTKYLWSVMLDEGNLKEHLQLIRDYYALGRGELFHQFIAVAEAQVRKGSEQNFTTLNSIFYETARNIYGEHDKSYLRFELTTLKASPNTNPWSKLQLNFEINWPLHIIFHPQSMELYNKLFSYLLRLSKTQTHLNKLWLSHMAGKQKIDGRVWTLRQKLMFLVNNLQYYLQVDVIEAEFSVLFKAVESANEFEDIIKVHHQFVSNLLSKTFVLMPDETHTYQNKHSLHQMPAVQFNVPSKVYNVVIRFLELCDGFCLAVKTWEVELTEPNRIELQQFEKNADLLVDSLLVILYKLHEKAKGQHLLQLLYQLDFNRYFSKNTKTDLNLTNNLL